MIGPLSPTTATRLDEAARDNGFDLRPAEQEDWLVFACSQSPLRLWLGALGD